jgi:Fe-S cluster assembly protein SufD
MKSKVMTDNITVDNPELQRWLNQQRELLANVGMPTRRDEDWRSFCWPRLKMERYAQTKKEPKQLDNLPKRAGFDSLVFVDGVYAEALSDNINWPAGVVALPVGYALSNSEAVAALTEAVEAQSAWQTANNLNLDLGFYLHVPAGVKLEKPVQFLQITTRGSEGTQTSIRHAIVLEEKAQASIWFENYSADKTEHVLVNQQNTIRMGEESRCHVVTCQRERGVQRLVHADYQQAKSSHFESFYMGLNTDWTREQSRIELVGEETKTRLRGLLFPTDKQFMAVQSLINHTQPNTNAKQVFRSVAADQGVAQLQGRVLVQPGADKTYSTQSNKSILLDPGAEARSCPQLEIYADDVVCNHGASIGELEEKQLFYLESRGIDVDSARRMLLHGFAQAVVDEVSDAGLKSELLSVLECYWGETNT